MSGALGSLALLAAAARAAGSDVPSPCVSVCRMNDGTGLCEGCLRTLGEIAHWSRMDDAARRVVWTCIEQRIEKAAA